MSPEQVEQKVQQELLKQVVRYPSMILKAAREFYSPGYQLAETDEWLKTVTQTIQDLGGKPEPRPSPLGSEAGAFHQKGFSVLSLGPGFARSNLHGPNERISMTQLQQAVGFYERMIEKVCL
jgi:acetylornithine deacetylase/succinyl-diaminopimelate desuccinylase-like protein